MFLAYLGLTDLGGIDLGAINLSELIKAIWIRANRFDPNHISQIDH